MTQVLNLLLGGVFHAAALFLVAAGLQLVFGVQKILNLACGSFYALGACRHHGREDGAPNGVPARCSSWS